MIARYATLLTWEEGHHPQLIQTDAMMINKIQYIHANPVKRDISMVSATGDTVLQGTMRVWMVYWKSIGSGEIMHEVCIPQARAWGWEK